MRETLFRDLEKDGLMRRNVPFSTMRRQSPLKTRNVMASPSGFITKNDSSVRKLPHLGLSPSITSMMGGTKSKRASPVGNIYSVSKTGLLSKRTNSVAFHQKKMLVFNDDNNPNKEMIDEAF